MKAAVLHAVGDIRYEDVPVLASWSPAVDVREEDGRIVLSAELPGVPLEDIQISVENNVLTISGERRFEKDTSEEMNSSMSGRMKKKGFLSISRYQI